jgi:hypothetical protein
MSKDETAITTQQGCIRVQYWPASDETAALVLVEWRETDALLTRSVSIPAWVWEQLQQQAKQK